MTERLQIIWTPWRNHTELLHVRQRFFRVSSSSASDEQAYAISRKTACDQVSAWKLRGNLPHAVESTWLLTEAILIDETPVSEQIPIFAIKAAYITAISRFVTGLLDAQQESKYKVSMYAQAQKVGLPALLVDIRHEAAHGEAPNLPNLRAAAERALQWLWNDYWKGLSDDGREGPSRREMMMGDGMGGDERTEDGEKEMEEEEQPGCWQKWQGNWTPKPIGTV